MAGSAARRLSTMFCIFFKAATMACMQVQALTEEHRLRSGAYLLHRHAPQGNVDITQTVRVLVQEDCLLG